MLEIPQELKCDFEKVTFAVGMGVVECGDIVQCQTCGEWTANLPKYQNDICAKKDRRKGERRREK